MEKINSYKLAVGKIFSTSWRLSYQHVLITVGLFLGYMVLSIILELLGAIPVVGTLCSIVSIIIGTLFGMGYTRLLLDAVDGKELTFAAFKAVLPKFWRYVGVSLVQVLLCFALLIPLIIYSVFTLRGSIDSIDATTMQSDPLAAWESILALLGAMGWVGLLLLLPVIYLYIRTCYATTILIDGREQEVWSAIKRSWQITRGGNSWRIVVMCLLGGLITLGGLLCLLIGVLFTNVIIAFAAVVSYRLLINNGELQQQEEAE